MGEERGSSWPAPQAHPPGCRAQPSWLPLRLRLPHAHLSCRETSLKGPTFKEGRRHESCKGAACALGVPKRARTYTHMCACTLTHAGAHISNVSVCSANGIILLGTFCLFVLILERKGERRNTDVREKYPSVAFCLRLTDQG